MLMKFSSHESTLIFIDLQSRLMPSIDRGNDVLQQCIRIAKIAQILGAPIIGTEQSPNSLGHNVTEISDYCQVTIHKEHFNACQDGLIEALPKNRERLVIAGCETHVCVMQTALELLNQGYQLTILVDAVGSRRSLDKEVAIQRLCANGAIASTVEMIAFEWLGAATNPNFKKVLELIKA